MLTATSGTPARLAAETGRGMAGGLLLLAAALHIWLLEARWINPDEGAHLMDVQLVLDGLVPEVDFAARQPLYVYSYVPIFKLFGASLTVGRVMPMLFTWIVALLLFLTARRVWSSTHGWIAALAFVFHPLVLINAPYVKTEPLTMVATAGGIYAVVCFLQTGRGWLLLAAGAAFAAGFYVRESALAGLLAATIVLAVFSTSANQILTRWVLLFGGMALVCIAVALWYLRFMAWSELLEQESLLPPLRVWGALAGFFGESPATAGGPASTGLLASIRRSPQELDTTLENIRRAMTVSAPLVVAAVFAGLAGLRRLRVKKGLSLPDSLGLLVSLAWLMSISLLYGYYALKRGFFEGYFRELVPPLALLFSWTFLSCMEQIRLSRHALRAAAAAVIACVGVYWIEGVHGGSGVLVALGAAALVCVLLLSLRDRTRLLGFGASVAAIGALAVLTGMGPDAGTMVSLRSWGFLVIATCGVLGAAHLAQRGTLEGGNAPAVAMLVLLTAAAVGSSTFASERIGLAFESPWEPRQLDDVVELIRSNSESTDAVLSGAVVWEFEAGRRVVANISHPLGFRDQLGARLPEDFVREMHDAPPKIIVLDGFTEQTYLPLMPELAEMIQQSYETIGVVDGAKQAIRVFARSSP